MKKLLAASIALASSVSMGQNLALEEIIVTAQKKLETTQDVPFAITAIDSSMLKDAGIQDMSDIAMRTPSLTMNVNTNPLTATLRLRGIGSEGNIPNFEPSVGYFVDGVFRSRSGLGVSDLVNVERIEILKGPQSTLYGKNVTGGVINVITKEPTHELSAYAEATYGQIDGANTEDLYRIKASVSGPLTDSVRASISTVYTDNGGNAENSFHDATTNEQERTSVRGQLVVDAAEGLEIKLTAGHGASDGNFGEPEIFYSALSQGLNAINPNGNCDNDIENRTNCSSKLADVDLTQDEVSLFVEYAINDEYTLNSVTSWDSYEMKRVFDGFQLAIDVDTTIDMQEASAFQQELRLSYFGDGDVEWQAGLFYYDNEQELGDKPGGTPRAVLTPLLGFIPVTPTAGFPAGGDFDAFWPGGTADGIQDGPLTGPSGPAMPLGVGGDQYWWYSQTETTYWATFAHVSWSVSDDFVLSGGIRYLEEEKDFSNVLESSVSTATWQTSNGLDVPLNGSWSLFNTLAPFNGDGNVEDSRDTDAVTWQISATYHLSDDITTYATVAKGGKGGGWVGNTSGLTAAERAFDDEEVLNFEVGVKSYLLDRRMQLNAAVFHGQYDDYQVAGFTGLTFAVSNAKEAVVQGIEFDGRFLINDEFSVDFGGAYIDTEYKDWDAGVCALGETPTAPNGVACIRDGESFAFVPELKFTLGVQYEQDISIGTVVARVDTSWSDEYLTNANMNAAEKQDSFTLVNARAGLTFGDTQSWNASLWANNLTDETVVNVSGMGNVVTASTQYFLTQPRTMGLTVSYTY
ncbi:MAG TPA: hypothetical protein ENI05_05630 [Porticoccus sp.]|nr:hypothetical protein [Porticoccus sp.]